MRNLLFLEKLSKFDPETATDYKTMFEAAIQREHKKALKLGIMQGLREGELRGKQEGIKEGIEKGKVEIARQMLSEGLARSIIAKVTSLSLKDIKALVAPL